MTQDPLLTRDNFRNSVFERDQHRCVLCKKTGQDAHHIIERRLFPDGGYYLNNGATVCGPCHLACEATTISVEEVRKAAGITTIITPPHYYPEQAIDKWGNFILDDGRRSRGPLFSDGSVQKILDSSIEFVPYTKYGRTMHLPWSPGLHDDDRRIDHLNNIIGHEGVITEKKDGENTSIYNNYIHARSLDSVNHPSRDWVKAFAAHWQHDLPEYWRVCGENVYARHSIAYENLTHYFYGFSLWDASNVCLSWDDTLEWFSLLGITPVPVLYRGIITEEILHRFDDRAWDQHEGYIVRRTDAFTLRDFPTHLAKFVRANHVQTNKHWMRGQAIIPNGLTEPYRSQPKLLFPNNS